MKDWLLNLQKEATFLCLQIKVKYIQSPPLELTHVRGMGGGPGGGLMIVVEYVSGGSNTRQNSSGDHEIQPLPREEI